jgi:hypothetical protein
MSKIRLIKPGTKDRIMVRAPCGRDLVAMQDHAETNLNYESVGLVKFWKHVLFWWKKKKT